MKTYFKFIGYLTLALWLVGLIAYIMYFAKIARVTTYDVGGNNKITTGGLDAAGYFYYIIMLILYIIVGPSLGLLFISHAGQLEKNVVVNKLVEHDEIMQEEIQKHEEIKKQENIAKAVAYRIEGNNIYVDGRIMNIRYITNVKIDGEKVTFNFYSRTIDVDCKDEEKASILYNRLLNK